MITDLRQAVRRLLSRQEGMPHQEGQVVCCLTQHGARRSSTETIVEDARRC